MGIALVLPTIASRVWMIATTSFFGIAILIHCGLYSFSGRFFSFSDIMFADDGAEYFSLDYIKIRKIIFISVFAAIAVSVIASFLRPGIKYDLRRAAAGAVAIIAGSVGVYMIGHSFSSQYVTVSWDSYAQTADIFQSFTDRPKSMMLCGLYEYTVRDLRLSLRIDEWFADNSETAEAIAEYYGGRVMPEKNGMSGIFEGKNLILVQLEAIDTWMVTPEAMPNLYALREESINFTDHFAPTYLSGGTFNTEIMVNLGLFPPIYGGKTGIYAGNDFPLSLPNIFSDAGYLSRSFHNAWGETYSRSIVHKNWGYERFYGGDDFGIPDVFFDSGLIAGFDLMTEGDPFYSFIITYSGHGDYPGSAVSGKYYSKFEEIYPDAEPIYIHSMAHAYETDLFVGELIDALEESGLRDDTVLAFYSDHYNYYTLDDSLVMKYKGVNDKNMMKRVLFFINSTSVGPMTVDKVTSSIDILPTIADLFGLDGGARLYAGDSAFSNGGGYVIFEDHSWYDGERYYKVGESETDEFAEARNREIDERMYYSNKILLTDWFSCDEWRGLS